MKQLTQTLRSAGLVLLAALALLLVLALCALAAVWVSGGAFAALYWRACSAAGGLVLLVAAVLLLTNNFGRRARMRLWQEHFPALPFTAAVVLVGAVLVACAGAVNYLAS